MKQITVLYNTPDLIKNKDIKEADLDTYESAFEVNKALNQIGYASELLGINGEEVGRLNELKTDLVFNLVEWAGNDTKYAIEVIELLKKKNIPFTGSDSWGYQLSADKLMMKKTMQKKGIVSPLWYEVKTLNDTLNLTDIKYPVIVKPAYEHCGIGIDQTSVVNNSADLQAKIEQLLNQYKQPLIVEEYIDGLEAHVSVLEKDHQPWVLPPAVFGYKQKENYLPIMTYEAKWDEKSWENKMTYWVEDLPHELVTKIMDLAKKCFLELGGRSYPRVDMRIKDDKVFVLEINNNPGIGWDEDSGITYSCKKAGLDFESLIKNIVENAT